VKAFNEAEIKPFHIFSCSVSLSSKQPCFVLGFLAIVSEDG
jgi:hypothetical protein